MKAKRAAKAQSDSRDFPGSPNLIRSNLKRFRFESVKFEEKYKGYESMSMTELIRLKYGV